MLASAKPDCLVITSEMTLTRETIGRAIQLAVVQMIAAAST